MSSKAPSSAPNRLPDGQIDPAYEKPAASPAPPPASGERMLRWFAYEHLPPNLRGVSASFADLAREVCDRCEPGPERTVALRKLLEAKDAAVRAKLDPGG